MTAFTKFDHLLNALESAGHQQVPADHGYGKKRRAVLQHVAEQTALIKRCETALNVAIAMPRSHEATRLAVQTLAAIAAHKGQS